LKVAQPKNTQASYSLESKLYELIGVATLILTKLRFESSTTKKTLKQAIH
jgi:hypothetical protein